MATVEVLTYVNRLFLQKGLHRVILFRCSALIGLGPDKMGIKNAHFGIFVKMGLLGILARIGHLVDFRS